MGLEGTSGLSRSQLTTVAEIVAAGGVLSGLSSLAIMMVFLSAKNLRESFAFQLVFGLSCAELGNSLWPWFFMPSAGTAACTCQAVTLQVRDEARATTIDHGRSV